GPRICIHDLGARATVPPVLPANTHRPTLADRALPRGDARQGARARLAGAGRGRPRRLDAGCSAAAAGPPGNRLMTIARHPRYEPRDIPARAAVYSVGGLFGLIALAVIVVAVLFQIWPAAPPAPAKPNVPAPRLESREGQDRPAIDEAAGEKLKGYGW